jgi:multidrug resistance efflux pump
LVKLDDRLASNRLRIAKARLSVAEEEYKGSYQTYQEAEIRYEAGRKLYERNPPLISAEEFREKKLARDKFHTEAEAKKAHITVAEGEVANAQILLDMHEIRSPVNGVLRAILRRPGEGVKALDPVVEIVPQNPQSRDRRDLPIPRP